MLKIQVKIHTFGTMILLLQYGVKLSKTQIIKKLSLRKKINLLHALRKLFLCKEIHKFYSYPLIKVCFKMWWNRLLNIKNMFYALFAENKSYKTFNSKIKFQCKNLNSFVQYNFHLPQSVFWWIMCVCLRQELVIFSLIMALWENKVAITKITKLNFY